MKAILTRLKGFLETSLFKLGETQITLLSVAYFLLLLILLVYISGKSKTIVNRVLARGWIVSSSLRVWIKALKNSTNDSWWKFHLPPKRGRN